MQAHLQFAQGCHTSQKLQKSLQSRPDEENNKTHERTTKYKKHRADKGFRECNTLNKLPARLTGKCSESPTIFYTEPLPHILKININDERKERIHGR